MPGRKRDSDDPALKPVSAEILDQFVDDGLLTAQDIDTAMRRFKKALIERALGAELTHRHRSSTEFRQDGGKDDIAGVSIADGADSLRIIGIARGHDVDPVNSQ